MIIPMKRLTLVALKADEQAILKALQRVGAVEIISHDDVTEESAGDERLEAQVQRFASAAQMLKRYGKKPPMGPPPEMSEEELLKTLPESQSLMERAEELDRTLALTRAEMDKITASIENLLPWAELDAPVESIRPTRNIRYAAGLVRPADIAAIEDAGYAVEAFAGERETAALVACGAQDYEEMQRLLKELDFSEYTFPAVTGTPRANICAWEAQLASLRTKEEETRAALAQVAAERALILSGMDAAAIERDRAASMAAVTKTSAVFLLDGWMRADEEERVQAAVAEVAEVYSFETRDPAEDEIPPTVMKNPPLTAPFETIVSMYSEPNYRGVDATGVMAPFYFLFFGMMLSDTGYGLALFLGGLLFTKLLKPRGGMGKLAKVITLGGISAMICGPFIGTFFGMDWNDIFGTVGVFPLLLDPMSDVMEMMLLSCGLGLVHMFTGIIVKMYMCFRDGDPKSAIFDNLSWILLLTGLILLFALPALKTVALVLTVLGGGMLLLFSGRAKKNPIMRVGSGLGALYNITGYLSDILSYVRIFALGLVSGAMGMVFNLIGSMVYSAFSGLGVVGVILGVIFAGAVLLVLHVFSLFINTLGAYAHCARLQFIEFFGKFYEAGGKAFKPLRFNTRNVVVRDK